MEFQCKGKNTAEENAYFYNCHLLKDVSQVQPVINSCTGGMFDCDSDRRDFAKNQYKEFVKRNGGIVPEDGKASTTETANGKGKQSAASAAPTIN